MTQAFRLYPAIDVLGGRCVRLLQGDYHASTEYSEDPVQVAHTWCQSGIRYLHVVDLDGAKQGHSVNALVIRGIAAAAASYGVNVQVGGGIRDEAAIAAWLDVGVERVVIGTASRNVPLMAQFVETFGQSTIVAGLDGRGGKLAVDGWLAQTELAIVDLAEQLAQVGVAYALVTDVDRDGTKRGANLDLAVAVQQRGLAAIASGGIRDEADIVAAQSTGLAGAIVGKALYDGHVDLQATLHKLEEACAGC